MITVLATIVASMGVSILVAYWVMDTEKARTEARLRAIENRIDLPQTVEDMRSGKDWDWPGRGY